MVKLILKKGEEKTSDSKNVLIGFCITMPCFNPKLFIGPLCLFLTLAAP